MLFGKFNKKDQLYIAQQEADAAYDTIVFLSKRNDMHSKRVMLRIIEYKRLMDSKITKLLAS